jgi:Protein of unknown function (DUF3592)
MISLVILLVLGGVGAFLIWYGRLWVKVADLKKQVDQQLDQQGVDTDAEIVNNRYAAGGRGPTYYFLSYQYTVKDPDGQAKKFTNEEAVSSADYHRLKLGDPIKVRYLPDNPNVSRLGSGVHAAFNSPMMQLSGNVCVYIGVALAIFGVILAVGQTVSDNNRAASATAYMIQLRATPNTAQKTATVQIASATAQSDRITVNNIRNGLASRLADWKTVDDRVMHRVLPPETDLNLKEVEIDYGYCANGAFYLYVWTRIDYRLDLKYEIDTFFDGYGYVEGSTPPNCYPREFSQVWLRNGGALGDDWYAVSGTTVLKTPNR